MCVCVCGFFLDTETYTGGHYIVRRNTNNATTDATSGSTNVPNNSGGPTNAQAGSTNKQTNTNKITGTTSNIWLFPLSQLLLNAFNFNLFD